MGFFDGMRKRPWIVQNRPISEADFVQRLVEYLHFSRDLEGYLRIMQMVSRDSKCVTLGQWVEKLVKLNDYVRKTEEESRLPSSDEENADCPSYKKCKLTHPSSIVTFFDVGGDAKGGGETAPTAPAPEAGDAEGASAE